VLQQSPTEPTRLDSSEVMESRTTFTYRPALDGLRALAVVAVMIYHVDAQWLPGGFLGVDVFFVLSGFLIATLLLIEKDRYGRIDLPRFWTRRFRRLMPALIVALIVIALVEHTVLDDVVQRVSRREELFAGLFYFANWHFIATDSSYFTLYTDASPIRHMWSLAIEEQFYFVFPALMAFGLGVARRRWLHLFFGVAAVASVGLMAVLYDPNSPSRAYYGTDTRIFQILIGVLLAWYAHNLDNTPRLTRIGPYAPAFLAGLVASFILIGDQSWFYYHGGAALVAILTAGLIVSLEHRGPIQALLSTSPAVGVGKVSYGVYLWHWPIILWLRNHGDVTNSAALLPATVSATGLVAGISYILVERPIRQQGRLFGLRITPRRLLAIVPIASALTAVIIVLSLGDTVPEWAAEGSTGPLVIATDTATPTAVPQTQTEELPVVTEPTETPIAQIKTVAVVGDSFVVSAYPGLRLDAAARGWTLYEAAFRACPIGSEPLSNNEGEVSSFAERCESEVIPSYEQLLTAQPDLIVWQDLQSTFARYADNGDVLLPMTPEWETDLIAEWSAQLRSFVGAGIPVVITLPPLRSIDNLGCEGAVDVSRCQDIQQQDAAIRSATQAFIQQVTPQNGVSAIEIDSDLCPNANPCPSLIDGIQVRRPDRDQTHFTEEGAAWFAPRWFDKAVAAREILTD